MNKNMSFAKINSSQFYFSTLFSLLLFINYHYLLCYLLFIVIKCSDRDV